MNTVGIIAGVIVGAAFVVAGASKLAAGPAWPAQASGLGVRGPIVAVVPWVEMVIGALTALQVVAPWPAAAAAALLVIFTGLIIRLLLQGKHPPCACFGAWSAKPLGAGHLARNVALFAVAVIAIAA
ncbi:MAG TPA: MauE/DoxX family redox-associated membrane protein [Ilumatobacter sp.]|nr:MauE/DoxX family redox-associated membrane protein [Ilumatobacter sp.]